MINLYSIYISRILLYINIYRVGAITFVLGKCKYSGLITGQTNQFVPICLENDDLIKGTLNMVKGKEIEGS